MVFNSWVFVFFFIVVYLLYLRLNHNGQNWVLLLAGYVFYGAWDYRFLSLLLISTLVDYFVAIGLDKTRSPRRRTLLLLVSLTMNLGMLGVFKYCDFFVDSMASLLNVFGYRPSLRTLGVVLPVGISFYTFQSMGYTIDVYRRKLRPCRRLRDFALFVNFFPQLVAGPISRATSLLEQVTRPRTLNGPQLRMGLWLLLQGFFLKVVVADNVAPIADKVFTAQSPTGLDALLGIYAFALQIYCDFCGYSQIARGLAKLMGFELVLNFRQPYLATNPSDFWQRWHISLSTWLRDYLYIPLGGNRRGPRRTYANLMTTMLLGGLWHGAEWKFVIWGFYQGLLLVLMRLLAPARTERTAIDRPASPAWRFLAALAFFQLTCLGWLIFRCQSVTQIVSFPLSIVTGMSNGLGVVSVGEVYKLIMLICPVVMMDILCEYAESLRPAIDKLFPRLVFHWGARLAYVTTGLVILLSLYLFGSRGGQPFIYFQF